MKTPISILEDHRGNVIGAITDQGDVLLAKEDIVPRAQLATAALTLASKYGCTIPAAWQADVVQPGG